MLDRLSPPSPSSGRFFIYRIQLRFRRNYGVLKNRNLNTNVTTLEESESLTKNKNANDH